MPINAGQGASPARNSFRADVIQATHQATRKNTGDYPAIASFEEIMP
jgi:hypothetical protein